MVTIIENKIRLIKEAYELHDTLNPKLFDLDTQELKPEVLEKLQNIAEEFLEFIDPLKLSIADIQFVGSNASYNYNDKSDIDLHIITNFDLNYIDDEILQSIYNDKKNKFNEKYNLTIYDIPVEVYIEDVNAGNATKGIYSILNNDWVMKPQPIHYDIPDYSKELKEWKSKIDKILKSGDKDEIEKTINEIYMMRKNGLAIDGEMAIGNLVFKELRNVGLIDGLRNKYYEEASDDLSLKESLMVESYKDDKEYQDLVKQLIVLRKQEKEIEKTDPGESYPSDEEMRTFCGYEKDEWEGFDRTEKEATYDLLGGTQNKEHEKVLMKQMELEKEISEIEAKLDELKDKEFQKQYKEYDLPKEYTRNSNECFKLDTNEYHQDYLENLDYAKKHGYNGCFIASMSPDEYMDRCSKEVFKSPIEDTYSGMENKHNVENYANLMKKGTKFDMPYLDVLKHEQEGRHRAMAAKELGIKEIPVLYLY